MRNGIASPLIRPSRLLMLASGLALLGACAVSKPDADVPTLPASPTALSVPGLHGKMLRPDYWQAKLKNSDAIWLDALAVQTWADRLNHDPANFLLDELPNPLTALDVSRWLSKLSTLPDGELFAADGSRYDAQHRANWLANLQLDRVPTSQPKRWGMAVRRADLRRFPTTERVFSRAGDTDIDRFQESALFPGTPVIIGHESADRNWWFVISPRYAAWVRKTAIAEGSAEAVRRYHQREPFVVVTGAQIQTVHSNETPDLSALTLDMGLRLPLLADWPATQIVNGQLPLGHYVVDLPTRDSAGQLQFKPALLAPNEDVSLGYLPLTDRTLLNQSFKFLGERYGWGHAYNARDCSGFVSEIYRSMGLELPRNTRDQGVSTALNRITFDQTMDRSARLAQLRELQVGDLLFIPGHVMMMIGFENGEPWVIHDTNGASLRGNETTTRLPLNGVVVTPLLPLLINEQTDYVDRLYSIQRLRP